MAEFSHNRGTKKPPRNEPWKAERDGRTKGRFRMQVTAEFFVCVECERKLAADKIAFDTDPEHYLGVCDDCDAKLQAAEALPAWVGREVA
jgi:hypothetical protein